MQEEKPLRKGSIVVGVCSMAKKTQGKPMQAILKLMKQYFGGFLEIMFFPEKVILNESVDKWPIVDCFICFHATGFPLEKAVQYCKMHPDIFVLNEPSKQYDLLDRTNVYRILKKSGIETPRHAVLRRDPTIGLETPLVEGPDHIEVGGFVFNKPFVEKPISAEDHNIYIYYASASGGGSHRLFRKVRDRSSEYSTVSRVRTEGSYIYENFLPTDGCDVKVYAVGPDYAHAEARKSPALDGKVERDSDGKEVRYPVTLSSKEKLIARKVVLAFQQTVCGFDLLRTESGNSCVCDVNGFSFVKTSKKYYEDSARILGNMILRKLAKSLNVPWTPAYQPDGPAIVTTTLGKQMELRCILGVIRHGDRTPKQKLKMEVKDQRFIDLFKEKEREKEKKKEGKISGDLKLKSPKDLQDVLDLARILLKETRQACGRLREEMRNLEENDIATGEFSVTNAEEVNQLNKAIDATEEEIRRWDQLRGVLEMYGHFAGIHRKIQIKYLPNGVQRKSSESETEARSPSILLVLKWGGELTPAGRKQAQSLGHHFRTLYPGIEEDEEGNDTQGLGFLRLHSTYRHDLKIYASDEGRVQMTAAAFAKGMLALEGEELAPIVSQFVKSANMNGLLDDDTDARKYQSEMKKCLHEYLTQDKELTQEDHQHLNPLESKAIRAALNQIKNPGKTCQEIIYRLQSICEVLQKKRKKLGATGKRLYMGETWELVERRWSKLLRDFRKSDRNGKLTFDISKIPDIYDTVRYDLQHNNLFYHVDSIINLYEKVKPMAEVVVPQEYGIRKPQKLAIAQGICIPLMRKIRCDLQRCIEGFAEDENLTRLDPRASQGIATPFRHVRTRLYFTSESHIHSVINLLRYGGLFETGGEHKAQEWERAKHYLSIISEFNYMSQIVLLMYEDTTKDVKCPDRFHIELAFSPGLIPLFMRPVSTTGRNYGKYRATRGVKDSKEKMTESTSELESATAEEVTENEEVEEFQLAECDVVSLRDLMIERPTNEQLAKHSPPGTPRESDDAKPAYPVLKSLSEVAIPPEPAEDRRRYGNRHHTVNFIQEGNKLLSTAVISGLLPSTKDAQKELSVVGGEMLVRGASAPDLKNCTMEESSRRLPPLFSLETLHNQLSHKMMDKFLDEIITIRTPIPSPPKTPQVKISRENSSLSSDMAVSKGLKDPHKTIAAVSERLTKLNQSD